MDMVRLVAHLKVVWINFNRKPSVSSLCEEDPYARSLDQNMPQVIYMVGVGP